MVGHEGCFFKKNRFLAFRYSQRSNFKLKDYFYILTIARRLRNIKSLNGRRFSLAFPLKILPNDTQTQITQQS